MRKQNKIISILGTKGGCGKSTIIAAIGAMLADMGHNVLMLDTDPQNSLGEIFKLEKHSGQYVYLEDALEDPKVLEEVGKAGLHKFEGLNEFYLLPNRKDYKKIQSLCEDISSPVFDELLEEDFFNQFEYILIDTQGSSGAVQGSVAFSSDIVLCPIVPKPIMAQAVLADTNATLKKLVKSKEKGRINAEIVTFLYQVDRSRSAKDIIAEMIPHLQSKHYRHLKTYIPHSNKVLDATNLRIPIHQFDYKPKEGKINLCEYLHLFIWELIPELYTEEIIFGATSLIGEIDFAEIKDKRKYLLDLNANRGESDEQ